MNIVETDLSFVAQRKLQRGSSLLVVLVVMSSVSLMVLAAASYSMQTVALSRKAQERLVSQTLAEAGVDAAIDTLTNSYKNTSASGTLYEDIAGTIPVGSYSATITDISVAMGQKKVVSVGTTAGGTARTVVARITQGNLALGKSAMMANGNIAIGGTANIQTVPLNAHLANIYSNGNVGLGGSGYVDGRLLASGSVTGTAYYPSVSGAPKYPFPDSATVTANLSAWYTASRATGNYYVAGNLFNGSKVTVTITAPAYISGDLMLQSSKTLILQGNGFIYLDGSLKLTAGALLKNGSTLIVNGSFTQQGQSNYLIDTTASPTPTLAVGVGDVTMNAGATTDSWGVIYAMSGNLKVNGNATFTGALVAGAGSISSTGTFTQNFPDMSSIISFPQNPIVTHLVEM